MPRTRRRDPCLRIPGEENIHLVDALSRSSIRFVLVRHEQGASFMAETFGRLTGKAGVCLATLGPGAINLLLGVADATTNSTPLIALSAQVGMNRSFKESHQGVDLVSMFAPVTKWSALVADAEAPPEMIRKAFKLAQTERPESRVSRGARRHRERRGTTGRETTGGQRSPAGRTIPKPGGPRRFHTQGGIQSNRPRRSRRSSGRGGTRPDALRRDPGRLGGHDIPWQGRVPRRPPTGPGCDRIHAARLRELRIRPSRRDRHGRLRTPGVRPGADQSPR